MNVFRNLGKTLVLTCGVVALVAGTIAVTTPRANAMPTLLCGPTFIWRCTAIGGPDVQFIGTVCEKAAFEQATGLTCKPFRR